MADWVVVIALIVTFAGFVTTHVALSALLLLSHKPRWRGLVALVLPPLAPFWGYIAGRRKLVVLWVALLAGYTIARIAASVMSETEAPHAGVVASPAPTTTGA